MNAPFLRIVVNDAGEYVHPKEMQTVPHQGIVLFDGVEYWQLHFDASVRHLGMEAPEGWIA